MPPIECVKYNTDGASRGNPGASAYAFCLRDAKGNVLYPEGKKIEDTTNTEAKAKAILEAVKHCKQAEYNRVIFQTDSLLLKQVLTMKWECPWCIVDLILQVRELLEGKEVHFSTHY
uniref:Putative ovule protein n=1 Tax=Solanum chacoense TaxID=4108 RepID=A0A0V0H2R5_SOLCH